MDKNIEISLLYDFYKELLTEKQADAIDLYYNQDFSLSEISEHLHITRQGVRDSIKRGEKLLFDMEEKLGLVNRFLSIQNKIETVKDLVADIEELNRKKIFSNELNDRISKLKTVVNDIGEKA